MDIHLTAEQTATVLGVAAHLEKDPGELVVAAISRLADEEEQFRAFVQEGIDQADRGEFIEEAEKDSRIERMLRR